MANTPAGDDAQARASGGTERLAKALALLLPFAAAILVYARFLDQWFFRDDTAWLGAAQNPNFLDFTKGAFTLPNGPTPYWRPLADFYFYAMYRVFSFEALPYHLGNLLFHSATASLTVLLVRRVSRSLPTGVLAGLLFAAAPAYGEGVIWISTASASMATLLSVTTIVLFLRYLDGDGRRGTMLMAIGTFALALLSMEGTICVPAVLLLLGLVVRPPKDAADARRFGMTMLPFGVLSLVYGAVQISEAYIDPTTGHQLSWHMATRLLDRILWLSLPLSSIDYGAWVDAVRWIAFATFALAAAVALLRRKWALPALFASTVFALIPSSLVTGMFAYRWVYLASLLWAGFVATLAMALFRWLSMRQIVAGVVAGLVVVAGLGTALLPHDTAAQRGMAGQAMQMKEIHDALEADCPSVGPGDNIFVMPLPLVDPPGQNLALSLIHILHPDATLFYAGAAGLPRPSPADCIIEWRSGKYGATLGQNYATGRFWTEAVSAPCPQAVPWQRAGLNVDTLVIIRGPVVAVAHVGAATILRVGGNKFRLMIPGDNKRQFPVPERAYLGRTICVRGVVRASRGVAAMTIRVPDVIAIE